MSTPVVIQLPPDLVEKLGPLATAAGISIREFAIAKLSAGFAIEFADVALDQNTKKVTRGGAEVCLRGMEFKLLLFFMTHVDQIFTLEEVSQQVWGHGSNFGKSSNVVIVTITSLRRKLGGDRVIHTVRGKGYVMALRPPST